MSHSSPLSRAVADTTRSNRPAEPLTRRRWLQATAATGCGLALARTGHAAAPSETAIDAHSHIWTRDVDRYPLKAGVSVADLDPASFTAEELRQVAAAHGVGRVVLIAHHTYYGYDNRYLIDTAERFPDQFKVVGLLDDTARDPAAEMRKLLKRHVTGFRITPWIRKEKWLDGDGMHAMWRCAAETGQAMCCLIDAANLPGVDAMCGRYPSTPVVIDHFARIGVDGQIRDQDVAALCRLARHKQTKVKLSAYYALGLKKPPHLELVPMIRRVLDAFGPERLMWASDAPYQLQHGNSYGDSIALIRQRLDFLSAGDKEWLLRKTAAATYWL